MTIIAGFWYVKFSIGTFRPSETSLKYHLYSGPPISSQKRDRVLSGSREVLCVSEPFLFFCIELTLDL